MPKKKSRGKGNIFKPTYRKADGSLVETAWYHVRWTDARGRQRKEKAAPTHVQAKEVLLKKLQGVADERQAFAGRI